MKAWRRKMNAALGAARAATAAGNHAAAANYWQAAMNRANNRGSSATQAAVQSQAPVRAPQSPGPPGPGVPGGGGGGGGGGGHHPQPHPHSPPPPPPPPPGQYRTSSVKVPEINIINFQADEVPSKQIEKMYFQDVGGTEILSVARHNTVGGEEVVYSHVDNLADIKAQFNPLNVLMSTNMEELFNKYAIDIHQKMPESLETSISTVESETEPGVWNIEILVENVTTDEYIQIQIARTVDEFEM